MAPIVTPPILDGILSSAASGVSPKVFHMAAAGRPASASLPKSRRE
jgi:hypothetical protein